MSAWVQFLKTNKSRVNATCSYDTNEGVMMKEELPDAVIHVANQRRSQKTKLQQFIERVIKVDNQYQKNLLFPGDNEGGRNGWTL